MSNVDHLDGRAPSTNIPWPVVLAGSLALVVHFGAIIVHILYTASGPWPVTRGEGVGNADPPKFLEPLARPAEQYVDALRLNDTYHWASIRPPLADSWFEARLLDQAGKEIRTLKFPEANAGPALRTCQALLAQGLGVDRRLEPPEGVIVYPKGQAQPLYRFWRRTNPEDNTVLKGAMDMVAEDQISRTEPMIGPSDWAYALARSYARHLAQVHDAAQVEIVRHSRAYVPPHLLFEEQLPPEEMFREEIHSFGVFARP